MTKGDKYIEALGDLRDRIDTLSTLMHDPFKAPELALQHFVGIQTAMFNVVVEYHVMTRKES